MFCNISVHANPGTNFFGMTFLHCNEFDGHRHVKIMILPPEIFTIIHPYLSLHDISSLILTNHEVNKWVDMNDVIREYYLARENIIDDLVITACKHGYINLLMYLHRTKNVIPDDAIKWASIKGHLSVVKYLCSVGVDPTVDDNYTIQWASRNGHLSVVEYLRSVGADPTANDNYPIILASNGGHLPVVKYLYSVGADITARDNTPITLACQNGHLDVVKYLQSVGADSVDTYNSLIRAACHGASIYCRIPLFHWNRSYGRC